MWKNSREFFFLPQQFEPKQFSTDTYQQIWTLFVKITSPYSFKNLDKIGQTTKSYLKKWKETNNTTEILQERKNAYLSQL